MATRYLMGYVLHLVIETASISPGQFHKTVFAARDAFTTMEANVRNKHEHDKAPGISGAFHLLKDEELWHALTPILEGLKTFTHEMDRDVERPAADRTGKSSNFQ